MSVFLLGAAPSLRACAHADCGKPIPDSERRLPSAIAGAGIPNDTVLQIKKRSPSILPVNSTLVYGNPATELPLLVERISVARGDNVRRARLDRHAAEWRAANNARRSHQDIDWDLAGGSFGAPHQSQLALSRRGLPPTLLAIADEAIE
jgi:hypothetical protein